MKKLFAVVIFIVSSFFVSDLYAQSRQTPTSQLFRDTGRIIRIAETGELSDSVNVWGDISSTGRYLIPRGTSLLELMTFGSGPNTFNDAQTRVDWSKLRVEVYINEFDTANNKFNVTDFSYRFEEALPVEMEHFQLKNNQTVIIRVKRKPTIRDYIGVIAPAISAVATSILLFERLSRL